MIVATQFLLASGNRDTQIACVAACNGKYEIVFTKFYKEKIQILKVGLIDLNFSNIMIHNEEYIIFDQEWITDEPLVFDYIKYFSIKLLYEQLPKLEKIISSSYWYKKYNISISMQKEFNQVSEKYFFQEKNVFDYKTYKILNDRTFIGIRDEIAEKKWKKLVANNQEQIQELSNQLSITSRKLMDLENRKSVKIINKLNKVIHKLKKTEE